MALSLVSAGMVTPVGFDFLSSCAAIRAGVDGFQETRFKFDGARIHGGVVPFEEGFRGDERMLQLVVPAIEECLVALTNTHATSAVLLCTAAAHGTNTQVRPSLLDRVLQRLSRPDRIVDAESMQFADGKVGVHTALKHASALLKGRAVTHVIVAAVDTLLRAPTLQALHAVRRLRTARNSGGLLPGEAGSAVLLANAAEGRPGTICAGLGLALEPAPVLSGEPFRADGLATAIRRALEDAKIDFTALHYRLADTSGEQYGFREASLGLSRVLRVRKPEFPLWTPAACLGDVGVAVVPILLGIALHAAERGYAPGPGALCHVSDDHGPRAVFLVRTR